MTKRLTEKEESFCQGIAKLGEDKKVEAYKASLYSQSLNSPAMGVQADKLFNKPNINLRIRELQRKSDKIAEEKFTITIEERLRRLDFIYHAGIEEFQNAQGIKGYQNLSVARQSIETLNAMLGVSTSSNVKPVKVQIGVSDAS